MDYDPMFAPYFYGTVALVLTIVAAGSKAYQRYDEHLDIIERQARKQAMALRDKFSDCANCAHRASCPHTTKNEREYRLAAKYEAEAEKEARRKEAELDEIVEINHQAKKAWRGKKEIDYQQFVNKPSLDPSSLAREYV